MKASRGLRTTWTRGPRRETGLKGKNGGPVIEQEVVKVLVPKGARA